MIYSVEDDDVIRELVLYSLSQTGMPALGFASAEPFWHALENETPDLILLDITLPGMDGLEILKKLRADAFTAEIPVIMLTARSAEYDKVLALELGADDYLTKPFGMAELIARIRARLRRRPSQSPSEALTIGTLMLDRRAHSICLDGQPLKLTIKEYALLRLLMENPSVAFSREQLLDRVWDMSYDGGTRTVDVHIQTLRAKLGASSALIETVRGVGYRFSGK